MAAPTNPAYAIVKDGELIVIDRGVAWYFTPGKHKKGEDAPEEPGDVESAFCLGDKLNVIDGKGVVWTYQGADGSWVKGADLSEKPKPTAEEKDQPWQKGKIIEGSPTHAEQVKQAKAIMAAEKEKEDA